MLKLVSRKAEITASLIFQSLFFNSIRYLERKCMALSTEIPSAILKMRIVEGFIEIAGMDHGGFGFGHGHGYDFGDGYGDGDFTFYGDGDEYGCSGRGRGCGYGFSNGDGFGYGV